MDAVVKPIRIVIKGHDNRGDDAPTVDDFLAQIRDQLEIFSEVERSISGQTSGAMVWRVTDLTKNSPLAVEVTPSPKEYGTNIDNRAKEVIIATARGLQDLQRGNKKPNHFNGRVLRKIEDMNKRVTNGLDGMDIDFSKYDAPNFSIKPKLAHSIIKNLETLKLPIVEPYRELGSVEGYVKNVGLGAYERPFVILTTRIDRMDVNCISSGEGLNKIAHLAVKQVIEGLRLRVFGILYYKTLAILEKVDVERVELFTPPDKLPKIEDLIDPDFTNGMDSVEYIRRMRNYG